MSAYTKDELFELTKNQLINHFYFVSQQSEILIEDKHNLYLKNRAMLVGLMKMFDKLISLSIQAHPDRELSRLDIHQIQQEIAELYTLTKKTLEGTPL